MRTYRPYVVKQGDYLAKLAQIYGFEIMEVWNHPLNAELKAKRGSADILYPGDVLHIPMDEPPGLGVIPNQTNRYVAILPAVPLTVELRLADAPLANESCEVTGIQGAGDAEPLRVATDGQGRLTLQVSPFDRTVHVHAIDKDLHYSLRVGEMDPVDTPSGVRKRLANLGLLGAVLGYGPTCPPTLLTRATTNFQRKHGLDPTGVVDGPTRDALVREHGS